jgi:hypothetical protein
MQGEFPGNVINIAETPVESMSERQFRYHLDEVNYLREKSNKHYQTASNLVLYSLVANAFVIAFISNYPRGGDGSRIFLLVASCMPALITLTSWILYQFRLRASRRIDGYALSLERVMRYSDFGYQHFRQTMRGRRGYLKSRHVLQTILFLQLLLAGALIIIMFRQEMIF